jgi:hypothetical protein
MKRNKLLFGFFILGCLFFYSPAFSEIIILKSGKTVEGRIIEETNKYVKIDSMGILLTYWRADIERIDRSESPVKEQPEKNLIKIKIKGEDSAQNDKKFIDKLDSLDNDIQVIIDDTQAKLTGTKAIAITDEHRNIVRKAIEDVKDKIIEIKKLNPPRRCKTLHEIFIKGYNLQIKPADAEINLLSSDELLKYWNDYLMKVNKIRDEYSQERKKTLDGIGLAS